MSKKCNMTVIGIALIWAAVIFASAFVLRETGVFVQLIPIYGAGAIMCIILTGNLCKRDGN
ncbi:hypothetical protein [Methanosalsum natronophilum]|uniref:Uncharacterized protein n=1 Tax=Methanosalsum natronophilum TaxID=768733 RepID=A0A424Z3C6_9EURY|nr:hypothetical protein [Methanosalsum natronophilum]RQD89114.1 MAG: hypothetical protein D5R95_02455 [Methanosalsum natronophilum]